MTENGEVQQARSPGPGLDERTEILIGAEGCARLAQASVLVAGLGGVGSHAAEALARAGVGRLILADHDRVAASNLNRQLVALQSTLGRPKVQVMAERIEDINPDCRTTCLATFLTAEGMPDLIAGQTFDLVVDAIDSLNSKVALLATALASNRPIFSSMGAGGRLDPGAIRIADLMETSVCPLARVVRQRLRRRGFNRGVVAVWSDEQPQAPGAPQATERGRPRAVNGTISYLPALFGFTLAGCAIRALLAAPAAERLHDAPQSERASPGST